MHWNIAILNLNNAIRGGYNTFGASESFLSEQLLCTLTQQKYNSNHINNDNTWILYRWLQIEFKICIISSASLLTSIAYFFNFISILEIVVFRREHRHEPCKPLNGSSDIELFGTSLDIILHVGLGRLLLSQWDHYTQAALNELTLASLFCGIRLSMSTWTFLFNLLDLNGTSFDMILSISRTYLPWTQEYCIVKAFCVKVYER